VETKRFVGSFVNVILTRQTCGQRSSRAAESRRRALGNFFHHWICYMFLKSKCRGQHLGLCTFCVLPKREPLRNGDFRKKTCFARRKNRNLALRSGILFASTQKVHRPRSQHPLHFDFETYGKFARKNVFPALGVCFPQPCSSDGRRFAASRSRLQNYCWIISFPQQKMWWNAL